MNTTSISERELFGEVLERETKSWSRKMRSFPPEQLDTIEPNCPLSARTMLVHLLERERSLHYILLGRSSPVELGPCASIHEISNVFDRDHAMTREGLASLSSDGWREVIRGPEGLGMWERGRRGEWLWLALKDLIRQGAHFTTHLRTAQDAVARRRELEYASSPAPALPS